MKKGCSLREYTRYLVAGTVVTGAIFLFDQQVYQRIHIKIKIIWILISTAVWMLLLFREFGHSCLLRLNLIPHGASTEDFCGQVLGEVNKGENILQKICHY